MPPEIPLPVRPVELGKVKRMLAGPNWIIDLELHDILRRVVGEYDELKGGRVVEAPAMPVVAEVETQP